MVSLPDESALAPDPPACFFPLTALRPALAHGHTIILACFSSRLDLSSTLLVIHYPSSTDGVERPFSFITWATLSLSIGRIPVALVSTWTMERNTIFY